MQLIHYLHCITIGFSILSVVYYKPIASQLVSLYYLLHITFLLHHNWFPCIIGCVLPSYCITIGFPVLSVVYYLPIVSQLVSLYYLLCITFLLHHNCCQLLITFPNKRNMDTTVLCRSVVTYMHDQSHFHAVW